MKEVGPVDGSRFRLRDQGRLLLEDPPTHPEGQGGVSQRGAGANRWREQNGRGWRWASWLLAAPHEGLCEWGGGRWAGDVSRGRQMMEGLGPRAKGLDLVLKAMERFGRGLSRLMRTAATCQALS